MENRRSGAESRQSGLSNTKRAPGVLVRSDQRVSPPGGWHNPTAKDEEDFRVSVQAGLGTRWQRPLPHGHGSVTHSIYRAATVRESVLLHFYHGLLGIHRSSQEAH